MTTDSDILQQAFGSERWKSSADALFEATGLSIAVLDSAGIDMIHSVRHCPYCDLAVRRVSGSSLCFDDPPQFAARGTTATECRGGIPCYLTPVLVEGRQLCTVFVGGFVSSTRERKRLFEKMLAAGVSEAVARKGVRDIPILPKRQVQAIVRMIVTNATDALERATERTRLEYAINELEVFVEAGREFTERRGIGDDLLEGVLVRGMAVINADSGSLMLRRSGTDLLEVVAPRGQATQNAHGRVVRFGEGIAGRVAENGRSMLVAGDNPILEHSVKPDRGISSAVCVPLMRAGSVLGVLNLNLSDPQRRVSGEDVRLIERYAHMAAGVIDNARKHNATERAMFELMNLSELAKMLSGVTSMDEIVSIAGSVLDKTFDFDIAGVVMTGWGRDEATVFVHGNVPALAFDHVLSVVAGRNLVSEPLGEIKTVTHAGELCGDADFDLDVWNVLPVELVVNDAIVGYVFVSAGATHHFDSDDRRLLLGMADHLALGMDKAALLQRMRGEMAKTIAALSVTLDAGEHASPGHSDRVMDYAMALGTEMDLGIEQIELLRFAGLLHDVGKAGISEEILLKPSPLEDHEMDEVRKHPARGASVVEQIEFLNDIAPIIMHHHERWDGDGYPMGLAREEIPALARILAIADAYDAMTSQSPYRRRMSFAEARAELEEGAGTQFDPELVRVFIDAMDRRALAGATGLLGSHVADSDETQLPA